MRWSFLIFVTILLLFALGSGFEASEQLQDVTESPLLEIPYERKLFKWNYKQLVAPAFEGVSNSERKPIGRVDPLTCPEDWFQWHNSCYYFDLPASGFVKAEKGCYERNSTLFVANSMEEWNAIRQHSEDNKVSWIGLVRLSKYEKTETLPRWQTEGGINASTINWWIKPYEPLFNGWTSLSNCVVHYNPPQVFRNSSIVYYQPCTLSANSICERNATVINY